MIRGKKKKVQYKELRSAYERETVLREGAVFQGIVHKVKGDAESRSARDKHGDGKG